MTRSKNRHRKRAAPVASEEGFVSPKEEVNIDALLEEVEAAVDSFNYDEATQKLNNILAIDSSYVKAIEMLAAIYIEQSQFVEAQNLFKKCVELSPDTGFEKYFSLGQLSEGEESLEFFQKGIQILEKLLENSENVFPCQETDKKSLIRNLSDAYCSVCEIFMTDCCFKENAEENCLKAIEAAIKADPSNSEAYQCSANFHLVKEQVQEAKEDMQKSLSLWLPHHEALRDGEVDDPSKDFENLIPTYDSRIQTSKLLIELEMFDEATNILDGLIEEDDEVVEVWYLLGWMNYIQGDEYKLNAHYYLNKAKEVKEKVGVEDADYICHIHELIEELKTDFPLDQVEEANEEECDSDLSSDSESDNKMET